MEDVIDLTEIFYLFRQKLLGILAALIAGGILVGGYTYFFVAPTYQATSKLYVVSSSKDSVINMADLQIGTSLTADYKDLILVRPMMESVIKNLDLKGKSVEGLRGMIRISNPSGTRILNITATSTDPVEAEKIANEMARLTVQWLPSVMGSGAPNIAEEAVVPTHRSSPSYTRNTVLGAIIFAIVYFAIEVVIFLCNDTIRTSEDFERYYGIVPLASVPEIQSGHSSGRNSSGSNRAHSNHRKGGAHK